MFEAFLLPVSGGRSIKFFMMKLQPPFTWGQLPASPGETVSPALGCLFHVTQAHLPYGWYVILDEASGSSDTVLGIRVLKPLKNPPKTSCARRNFYLSFFLTLYK